MSKIIEPYRILFPLGILYALMGVMLWLNFVGGTYPGIAHSRVMIGGFLISYVMGFLMTAVPRMTASFPASFWEIGLASVIVLSSGLFGLAGRERLYFLSLFMAFMFLVVFSGRRVSARTKEIPNFFIFVASGLMSGLVGAFLLWQSQYNALAHLLLTQGMLLSLVLGIGCRLVPLICGITPATGPAQLRFIIVVILLWISFIAESAGYQVQGILLRAAVSTWVGVIYWQIFSWPRSASRLALLIKIAAFMALAGLWLAAFQPGLAVHWMHLTYVGGFGLMTFTVASRVILAHGRYDLGFEARSHSLFWVGFLLLGAATTRAAAPLIDGRYLSHLQYAAILWLSGVGLWACVFVPKIIKSGSADKPACGGA